MGGVEGRGGALFTFLFLHFGCFFFVFFFFSLFCFQADARCKIALAGSSTKGGDMIKSTLQSKRMP